jgi:hypothetical protein
MMKLRVVSIGLAAALLCAGQIAQAGAVGARVSTLGIGVEYATNIIPLLVNARLQINGLSYNKSVTNTQVSYDGKLKLFTFGAIADVYPFAGKFRLSGGLYYNNNRLDITGVPAAGAFTLNGTTYTTAQVGSVAGKVDFNSLAPYIGMGWGDSISGGSPLGFSFEVGALYQGQANTSLTTTNTLTGAAAATLAANIAAEKKKLDDNLKYFKWYPVVSLGVSWKF